jgi:hypothetical protein
MVVMCLRTMLFSSSLVWPNGWCFLWSCTSPLAAGSAGCYGAASSSLSQMTKLLVSNLSMCVTQLQSDPFLTLL